MIAEFFPLSRDSGIPLSRDSGIAHHICLGGFSAAIVFVGKPTGVEGRPDVGGPKPRGEALLTSVDEIGSPKKSGGRCIVSIRHF